MKLLVVVGLALAVGFSSAAPTETGANDVEIYRQQISQMEAMAIYIIKVFAQVALQVADSADAEPNAASGQNPSGQNANGQNANAGSPYSNGENSFNQYAYGENANIAQTGGQQWS